MTTEIAVKTENRLTEIQQKEINSYLTSLGSKLSPHHRDQFISICREFQLNPFAREIYGIPYGDKFNIIVGYEVYLKRAERSGQLDGWKVWVEGAGQDMVAKIEIHRKDREQPFHWEVEYSEYEQKTFDKQARKWVTNSMWKSKPKTMLKKVAIAQAFRMFFPEDCGGMPYTSDEIPLNGDQVLPQPPVQAGPVQTKAKKIGPEIASKPPQNGGPEPEKEEAEDAEVVEPEKNGIIGPVFMRETVMDNPFVQEPKFPAFLIAKKWLKKDQKLEDLTDNQIERLYNNFPKMLEIYKIWKGE